MTRLIINIILLTTLLSLSSSLHASITNDTINHQSITPLPKTQDTLYTVKGTVVGESIQETLPGAHIYIGSNKQPTTVTDALGQFTLTKIPRGEILITASFVGYKFISRKFIVKADTNIGYIKLQPEILEEVTVTATPPLVTQNGDTTQFNATAVKVAEDAYLEDLLKKLPGFQVIDGKLIVNGEEVKKLYIDGTEYFINNPMTALSTLPANLISKIKMYDDQNEKSKFSGFDDGDRLRSLNIETKNPNQLKIFGNATLGHSISEDISNTFTDNNYTLSANANAFNQKQKLSVNGSMSQTSQGEDLPNPIYKGKGGDNTNKGFSIDFSNTFKKSLQLGGNYSYNNNESYSASMSKQDYFPTDYFENRIFNNESHSWNKSNGHNVRIQFMNQNFKAKNQLSFHPSFSRSVSDSRSLSLGNSIENSDTVNVTNTQSRNHSVSTNAGGSLIWAHRLAKGRTINLYLNANVSKSTNEGTQQDSSVINKKDTLRNLINNTENLSQSLSASTTFTEQLGDHINVSADYTFSYNKSQSDRKSLSYHDSQFTELIGLDSALTNRTTQNRLNHNISLGMGFHRKDLYLSGSLGLQLADEEVRYKYLNTGDSLVKSNYCDLSPRINFRYTIDSIRRIEISYSGNTSSPSANDLQDVLDVTDQLNVSKGNPHLKKTFSQHVSANYSDNRYTEESFSYFQASLSFSNTFNQQSQTSLFINQDTVINGYTVLKGARFSMPINLNGQWSISASASYSTKINPLKMNISTSLNYDYSHSPSINDNIKNFSNEHRVGFNIRLNSNISEDIDFNISSNTSYSHRTNTAMEGSSMISESVNADFRWTTWKEFVIGGNYSFSHTLNMQQTNVTTTNSTLNMEIGKKFLKKKQLYLRFRAMDILRQRNIENYNLADTYASTSYNTTPQNYYQLSLSYRFNSMNRLSKGK